MPLFLIIFNIIDIIVRIVIAVQLCRLACKNVLDNFYWFAVHFILLAVVDILTTTFMGFGLRNVLGNFNSITFAIIIMTALGSADICLAVFVFKTFYQDQKSAAPVFLGIAVIWATLTVILLTLAPPIFTPNNPLTFLWAAFAAWVAYREIACDKSVDDWVKGRYLLLIIASIVMAVPTVESIFTAIRFGVYKEYEPLAVEAVISIITATVLYYLAWVMPEFFRRFLNRNYKQPEVVSELPEDEVMKKLRKVGT